MAPPVAGIKVNENGIPDFEDLPLRKSDPRLSAWGLYGDKDELGTLNRLTDERVAAAAKSEIRTGQRISLNWPLNSQPRRAFFQRKTFHHDIFPLWTVAANDDVWTLNPQASSQWDSLRHFGYLAENVFYNGVTMEDIHGLGGKGERNPVNGIQAWAEQGIVGRGVLVDYYGWKTSQPGGDSKVLDPFDSSAIPLADLKACLEAQGTELQFGDILIIRSGFMVAHKTKTTEQLWEYQGQEPHRFIGVEQTEDVLKWIWSNFSAVAGDQPAFERWPTPLDWHMHEVLLAGWGCPIGELFDLEKLAAECRRQKRWSFFVSSEPCNVPGGVASPPNILAIF